MGCLHLYSHQQFGGVYVEGEKNVIADYLSRICKQDDFSLFGAALSSLYFTVDRVSQHSGSTCAARTANSRLNWYKNEFCRRYKIQDPYLTGLSYKEARVVFACYAVFLALGHTLLCKTIKSATIGNYLRAAANDIKAMRSRIPNLTNNVVWADPTIRLST